MGVEQHHQAAGQALLPESRAAEQMRDLVVYIILKFPDHRRLVPPLLPLEPVDPVQQGVVQHQRFKIRPPSGGLQRAAQQGQHLQEIEVALGVLVVHGGAVAAAVTIQRLGDDGELIRAQQRHDHIAQVLIPEPLGKAQVPQRAAAQELILRGI